MQVLQKFVMCLLLGSMFCGVTWAMDFASMSNQDLADLRGAIQKAPEADQMAFQQEWAKRLAAMPAEEKKQYEQPQEPPGSEDKLKKPYIQGRGYDNQGTGTVIYGGIGTPGQGGGKAAGK